MLQYWNSNSLEPVVEHSAAVKRIDYAVVETGVESRWYYEELKYQNWYIVSQIYLTDRLSVLKTEE